MVGVGAGEWVGGVADGVDRELGRRGVAGFEVGAGSREDFEEKLVPGMDGFGALCRARLSAAEVATLCDWTVLVPVSLDEPIRLPIGSAYTDFTLVAGAPQVLGIAERLAAALGLPGDIPAGSGDLGLTAWFLDGHAKERAGSEPWGKDLDAAFYVALFLRAARHSLRYGCPIAYC